MTSVRAGTEVKVEGWYGPPNSRRFHYFRETRALCGKWLAPVLAGENPPWDCAYGPANGDCAECKRKLAASSPVPLTAPSELQATPNLGVPATTETEGEA